MSELKLQPNNGKKYNYGFLFKKTVLPPIYLGTLLDMDEFLSEINYLIENNRSIEDEDIYEILKHIYFPKHRNQERSPEIKAMHQAIRRLSQKIYGDVGAWKSDFYEYLLKEGIPQEFPIQKSKKQYIVPSGHIYNIFRNSILSEAFKMNNVLDDISAYDTAKRILFLMLRAGYNKDSDKSKASMYCNTKRTVEVYAEALEGDKKAWQKDYDAYINDEKLFVVKMAARDGQFQEKALTIDELIAMKQQDDSLEDADENL